MGGRSAHRRPGLGLTRIGGARGGGYRIVLGAVGRLRGDPAGPLFTHYAERLKAFHLDLIEVEAKQKSPASTLREAEGERLLAALPAEATLIALDEQGETLDSRAFALRLRQLQEQAALPAFVIGGADGLAPSVRARAAWALSFGRMTWPHLLVRALLAEQLYRAQQILAGHPYHRD